MHNLKEIRKDFLKFKKDLEKRSVKIDINNLKNTLAYLVGHFARNTMNLSICF